MFCSNCTSDRLPGPYYAADRVTRAPRAMTCLSCGATFDAYESYGVAGPGYSRPVAA